MSATFVGKLLIAGPTLIDPNFFRTVVLVCEENENGALGVILNRSTDVPVGDHLPGWVERLSRPEVVFEGGPVQRDTALALARSGDQEPPGWSLVIGQIGLLDLTLPPGDVVGDVAELRVFAGYAGWGPDQLREEVASGDWVIAEPDPGDAFSERPSDLWREVLKRQAGPAAMYADFPLDPSAN